MSIALARSIGLALLSIPTCLIISATAASSEIEAAFWSFSLVPPAVLLAGTLNTESATHSTTAFSSESAPKGALPGLPRKLFAFSAELLTLGIGIGYGTHWLIFRPSLAKLIARHTAELEAANAACHLQLQQCERHEAELEHYAYYDSLTGLPNRVLLLDRLEQAIAVSRRYGHTFAVFFLDLDNFKPINDTWGHATGDRLLQVVAERLRGCLRDSDTVARLAGDEFAIVLPQLGAASATPQTALAGSCHVAQKLLDTLSASVTLAEAEFSIGASIGITLYPHNGATPEELLDNADTAMYRAKQQGKNTFAIYRSLSERNATGDDGQRPVGGYPVSEPT
jgi:diguanylate cyclase (GGDEF)-like protein